MPIFHNHDIDFSKIPELVDGDIAFLSDVFQRFPRVAKGYSQFTQANPLDRIKLAGGLLEKQPRTGWKIRFDDLPSIYRPILNTHSGNDYGDRLLLLESSIPSTESVLEHSAEAVELFMGVYRNYPKNHRQWGMECMKFHDFHEAIDGDFTPHCPITKDEKKRLEGISTKLLCESGKGDDLVTRHIWNCTQIFEGHMQNFEQPRQMMLRNIEAQRQRGKIKPHQERTVTYFETLYKESGNLDIKLLQQQTADIDALHMAVRSCRILKEGHIKKEDVGKMEEFWNYVEKKLQTPEAKSFFAAFKSSYLDDGMSYEMALARGFRAQEKGRSL